MVVISCLSRFQNEYTTCLLKSVDQDRLEQSKLSLFLSSRQCSSYFTLLLSRYFPNLLIKDLHLLCRELSFITWLFCFADWQSSSRSTRFGSSIDWFVLVCYLVCTFKVQCTFQNRKKPMPALLICDEQLKIFNGFRYIESLIISKGGVGETILQYAFTGRRHLWTKLHGNSL